MPVGTPIPFVKAQWFDNNGDPASAHRMFAYAAGTTTKINTYSDVGLTTANANPLNLDSAGRATIFLTPGVAYKFVLALQSDSDPALSPLWTMDNVTAVPASTVDVDVTVTAGENLAAGEVVYASRGDGGRTAGRWYKADADLDYGSTLATDIGFATVAILSGESGSVRTAGRMTGLTSLTVGSMYYVSATGGAITATAPAKRRRVGVADSTTSLLLGHFIPTEPQVVGDVQATVGNIGAGEDVLASITVPAGRLDAAGMVIRGIFAGKTANNANVKTIKLRAIEGANNNIIVSYAPVISQANNWMLGFVIKRTGASTARATCQAISGIATGPVDTSVPTVTQPTLTWANAVEIRVTGEATTTDDITIESGDVVVWPGPV